MAVQMTLEKLGRMSVQLRANLYRNACAKASTEDGAALKKMIEEAGLPYSDDTCLSMSDPITIRMREIIQSNEGRAAALEATRSGLPAIAGIDPMLQVALGVDYGPHNMGTNTAGALVGEMMKSLGYRQLGKRSLPSHCVAKTAAMWG